MNSTGFNISAQKQKKSYIYAFAAILFWSTVATAFKIALKSFDYIQLLFYSNLTALTIFFIVLVIKKKIKDVFNCSLKQYLYSMLLGLLNPFAYYLILFKAYSLLPAQLAQPLNMIWPVTLVLLSIPLLKQKITFKNITAIVISFLGVVLISMKGEFFNFSNVNLFGVFLALFSSVVWSLFWILNVRDKRDEVVKLFLNFLFSLFLIIPYMLIFSKLIIPDKIDALSLLYIGTFEMGISFIFWLKAMKLTSSNDMISGLAYISPFLSLIFIHFILGENIFITTIIGLILIVTGILYQKINWKKKKSY
ncbi:MAG: DMT family transporter [Marinilabiliales bacterium]